MATTAEEMMFKAKLPFVVIDPVRAWWGLRSSRDGQGPGLSPSSAAAAEEKLAEVLAEWSRRSRRPATRFERTSVLRRPQRAGSGTVTAALVSRGLAPQGLTEPQQRIADTVAMLNVRGIDVDRDAVARWLGLHPNGGSYGANLGHLRSAGYLDRFVLTDLGQGTARPQETGLEAALRALDSEPKRQILRVLVDAGHPMNREDLAAKLGLHPNGGSYGANLGWLRTMGILTPRGLLAPTDGLFR